MQAISDLIIERRRLRRRLALWRILAIAGIAAFVIALLPRPSGVGGAQIARVTIDGIILEDPDRDALIRELGGEADVRAVVLRISSPGGTVTGSEALYEAIRDLAAVKPVVAVIGEVGASGAYLAAIGAERVWARGNAITGSVGVIAEIPNVAGLLDMAGIEVTRVRSSPLKAEPGLTAPPSPEGLAAEQALIDEAYLWFRGIVAERRGLTGAPLDAVTDGRVFSGRQAATNGLIDAVGDEAAALDWLAEAKGIPADLPVADRDWREPEDPWPLAMLSRIEALFGAGTAALPAGPRLYAVIQ